MNYQHLKIAWRRMVKSPFISIINIGGLALGIACAYLGIAYANQEYSYEKSFSQFDKICRVGVDFMNMGGFAVGPEYLPEYVSTRSSVVESFSRVSVQGHIDLKKEDQITDALVMACDSNFFELFDYPTVRGKVSQALTQPNEIVISRAFAEKWFGDLDPIGAEIEIPLKDEVHQYHVSAVIASDQLATHLVGDIWIPIYPFLKHEKSWYSASFYTYFKLKDQTDLPVFKNELESIKKDEIYPKYGKDSGLSYNEWKNKDDAYRFIVYPLQDIHLHSTVNFEMSAGGNQDKVTGFLLIGLLILLVAVANYINLSTARGFVRAKEVGIKKSIGARQFSIFRQLLGEFLLESIMATVGAIFVINFLLALFNRWSGTPLLTNNDLSPDSYWILLIFGLISGVMAGVYPAIFLSKIRPINLLKRNDFTKKRGYLRDSLVVFQFAITSFLICGSLVIFTQLKYMDDKDLGFDKEGLMVIENVGSKGSTAETFRDELQKDPLVLKSSFSNSLPGHSNIYQSSYQTPAMPKSMAMRTLPVDADFIATMGIPLLEGQNFVPGIRADSTVAIINESAKKALGLAQALNTQISKSHKVIGVVSDFHMESMRKGIEPLVLEFNPKGGLLALRLKSNPGDKLSNFIIRLDHLWKELYPGQDLRYSFIDDTFQQFAQQEQLEGKGILTLTVMALSIACMGLLGLATFTMKKREKEISVRKILGAHILSIVSLLSKDFFSLIIISLCVAIPAAIYFTHKWLDNFAYRIEMDWHLYVSGAFISILIALSTIGYQSIRTALVNPVNKLRNE